MGINTEYDIRDEIWFISDHEIKSDIIIDFTIRPSEVDKSSLDFNPSPEIVYETAHHDIINERNCFSSKQGLINHLIK